MHRLLASLDASRWQFGSAEGKGCAQLQRAAALADRIRNELRDMPGFVLLEAPGTGRHAEAGYVALDPLRITVNTERICGGFVAGDNVEATHKVYVEVATDTCITLAMGVGCDEEDADLLMAALRALGKPKSGSLDHESKSSSAAGWMAAAKTSSTLAMIAPRHIYNARCETVSSDCVGISPTPPTFGGTLRFVRMVFSLPKKTHAAPGNSMWPGMRVGATAYLLQGITENKSLRKEGIERTQSS